MPDPWDTRSPWLLPLATGLIVGLCTGVAVGLCAGVALVTRLGG